VFSTVETPPNKNRVASIAIYGPASRGFQLVGHCLTPRFLHQLIPGCLDNV